MIFNNLILVVFFFNKTYLKHKSFKDILNILDNSYILDIDILVIPFSHLTIQA